MNCPRCSHPDDKVVDSRVSRQGAAIRRRRECLGCGCRFTTLETVIPADMVVVKRSGKRDEFNPQKIRAGIKKACYKLPVTEEQIDELLGAIIRRLEQLGKAEIASHEIGSLVMEELEQFNDVAYVRFASIYRQFRDLDQFTREIRLLNERHR
jgi:transcriptional repressor NrdR